MSNKSSYTYDVFDPANERWPKAGDQLLLRGRDAFLAAAPDERNYRLLRGYKQAGDILIQTALKDRAGCNNLVFPALYNYRHYIELALKDIINDHGGVVGVTLGEKNHKLPNLWQLFVQVVEAFDHDCTQGEWIIVAKCIEELARLDPDSTSFRYARTKSGDTRTLPLNIDLINLHDVMNGLENFFECVDLEFTHQTMKATEAMQYAELLH